MGVKASRLGRYQNHCAFDSLPNELLCAILGHKTLSFGDRIACQQVCHRWRQLLASPQVNLAICFPQVWCRHKQLLQLLKAKVTG